MISWGCDQSRHTSSVGASQGRDSFAGAALAAGSMEHWSRRDSNARNRGLAGVVAIPAAGE